MSLYTAIIEANSQFDVAQTIASSPSAALGEILKRLPSDFLNEEGSDAVLRLADDPTKLKLILLAGCKNTWLWLDGTERKDRVTAYIVMTEVQSAHGV